MYFYFKLCTKFSKGVAMAVFEVDIWTKKNNMKPFIIPRLLFETYLVNQFLICG